MTFFSRTAVETDKFCPRKRWLGNHVLGTGIQLKQLSTALAGGSMVHAMLADVLKAVDTTGTDNGPSINDIVHCQQQPFRNEVAKRGLEGDAVAYETDRQCALAEGLVRGWCVTRLPSIVAEYTVLEVERERLIPINGIKMATKVDAVLRRRSDQALVALEFKTTAIKDGIPLKKYLDGWRYDSQTIVHTHCVETVHGEPCLAVQMEFLRKRHKGKDASNPTGQVIYSPLIRGYRKAVVDGLGGDATYAYSYESKRGAGWEAFDVWQDMGVEKWLANMPIDLLQQQFITRSIYRNHDEVQRWISQTAIREQEIATFVALHGGDATDSQLAATFPGLYNSACYDNMYHKSCEFLPLCYEGLSASDAIASGEFQLRESHYSLEKEATDEGNT